MSKIKEKFLNDQSFLEDAIDDHLDDEYHYEEWLKSQGYKPVTMEETQAQHDAWWDSLTEEQKQKLYEEVEAAEQDRIDNDMNGLNSQYGV